MFWDSLLCINNNYIEKLLLPLGLKKKGEVLVTKTKKKKEVCAINGPSQERKLGE